MAISNLAWRYDQDPHVAALLRDRGVRGVELAPTKIWAQPLEISAAAVRAYRRFWEDQDIRIVALQALLFGRPDLMIFDSLDRRGKTFNYLAGCCRLAEQLGADVLVFGSPRNRATGNRSPAEVEAIARDFFGRIASVAHSYGVTFCIEPNPPDYQCDFVTRAEDGVRLVQIVGQKGFGLHLDTGAIVLSRDPVAHILAEHGRSLHHFHISEPWLRPVGEGLINHAAIGKALRASGYGGWVSIEMKEAENRPILASIDLAVRSAQRWYLADQVDSHELTSDLDTLPGGF